MAERLGPRPETELDRWQRHLWRATAQAIGDWLIEAKILDRPIRSLQITELEGIAWAAISKYTDLREDRRRELNMPFVADPMKPDPLHPLIGR